MPSHTVQDGNSNNGIAVPGSHTNLSDHKKTHPSADATGAIQSNSSQVVNGDANIHMYTTNEASSLKASKQEDAMAITSKLCSNCEEKKQRCSVSRCRVNRHI